MVLERTQWLPAGEGACIASWPPGLEELGVHRASVHCSLREVQFKARHDGTGLQSQPLGAGDKRLRRLAITQGLFLRNGQVS